MTTAIAEGVFFETPPPLPRGRHSVSRETIDAAQRERLLIAAALLTGTDGYRGFGIRELCRTAGVSQSVFYDHFADKDACVFAVYRRFIEVIASRLAAVAPAHADWTEYLEAFVASYLDALSLDPLVARACMVEMDALGETGRAQRRSSIREVSAVIHRTWTTLHPVEAGAVTLEQVVAATHLIRQSAADALDESAAADLRALGRRIGPLFVRALTPPA